MCFSVSTEILAYEKQRMFFERIDAHIREFDRENGFVPYFYVSGFAHPKIPVITSEAPDKVQMYQWGLIPAWVRNREQANEIWTKTLNAKSETIFEKPSFKLSIFKKRCIILVTGFFEWQTVNKEKIPWFIYPANEGYFAMGGIYEQWVDRDTGELYNTFALVTTPANDLMSKIHNDKMRMPLILPKEAENDWLNPHLSKPEIEHLMLPCNNELMQAHTISKRLTSRTEPTNVKEVQEPFTY